MIGIENTWAIDFGVFCLQTAATAAAARFWGHMGGRSSAQHHPRQLKQTYGLDPDPRDGTGSRRVPSRVNRGRGRHRVSAAANRDPAGPAELLARVPVRGGGDGGERRPPARPAARAPRRAAEGVAVSGRRWGRAHRGAAFQKRGSFVVLGFLGSWVLGFLGFA